MEEARKLTNKRIIMYLAITFVLTYVMEFFMVTPMVKSTDAAIAAQGQSLVATMMFIPALGALLTRVITKERFTGRNLMLALHLKENVKYYALAWLGIAAMSLVGTTVYFLIFRNQFDPNMGILMEVYKNAGVEMTAEQARTGLLVQMGISIVLAPLLNIVNCFGEEWGWRGYLLPKMLERFKIVPTLLICGVIWGLWHAPLTMLGHNYGVDYWGFPVVGIIAMCLFCIVMGIIFSYVTIKTKSCIPAIFAHGMLNGFSSFGVYFATADYSNNPGNVFLGPGATGLIGGVAFMIVAILLVLKLAREEKEKRIYI